MNKINMNTFSEKSMEDAIVNNPEKFINEEGLRLLARQYRVGSYIFDLLFEDRHGGKLIIEIQKGTLDRTHTYKILDYYHEYKEKNPRDFIDVMVIANIIPPERKRRLNDLGVDYKEVSESIFITYQSEISEKISENESVSVVIQNSKKVKMTAKGRNFNSGNINTDKKETLESLMIKSFGEEYTKYLADKYIKDDNQRAIFLSRGVWLKVKLNYIAGLLLKEEGRDFFTPKDIREILRREIPLLIKLSDSKLSGSLLTSDVCTDPANPTWHGGFPCLEKGEDGKYKFIGLSFKSSNH